MKKYKDTVNEAILLAVNNVPPVHGTSVFFINRIKNANKNKIALILAACALISCQDIIVYIYEEFFAEIKFCRIKFEKKVGLLQMVSNWSEQNLTRNAADFSTLFEISCQETFSIINRAVYLNADENSDKEKTASRLLMSHKNYRKKKKI
jgi:hypothetical protein